MSGFSAPLRKDQAINRGGGIALYVANHLSCARRFVMCWASCHMLGKITINRFKILCACWLQATKSNVGTIFHVRKSLFGQRTNHG